MNKSKEKEIVYPREYKIIENPIIRILLLIAGLMFAAIGVLGMFLPLLPTTVFLLLSAACFARSSKRFYIWLHTNRLFGKYISDYRIGKGMSLSSKITSITVLWITILISVYFSIDKTLIVVLLLAIAVGVSIHIIKIPVYKNENNLNAQE